MADFDFDVAVAGAGIAGCAAALSLADFAPELRVCLVGPAPPAAARIGETVPPPVEPILRHLGLSDRFAADRHRASYRTFSAWGTAHLAVNEFLFQTHQVGWRLDRARFDRMMLEAAAARVAAHAQGKAVGLSREPGGWRLALDDGSRIVARFVVDATGRAAALVRWLGLPRLAPDGLVGCSVHVEDRNGPEELLVETFPDGWWYTAGLPDGRRVIACMTDTDEVRRLGLRDGDAFARRLAETRHVRAVVGDGGLLDGPRLWPAGSRCVPQPAGVPFLCVGDAASCFDPVSGQGIVKALRSGIFASYAIGDLLRGGDERGLNRYGALSRRIFEAYRSTLRDFYALETRWADRPFWRRRHGALPAAGPDGGAGRRPDARRPAPETILAAVSADRAAAS